MAVEVRVQGNEAVVDIPAVSEIELGERSMSVISAGDSWEPLPAPLPVLLESGVAHSENASGARVK